VKTTAKCVFLALATAGIQAAADSAPKLETTETRHIEFPAGGGLKLTRLSGEVTVEGWDGPDLELTTVKYTPVEYTGADREKAAKLVQETHVDASLHGDQVEIKTTAPKRSRFLFLKFGIQVDVDYRIKVPRTARMVVDHDSGELHIIDLTGDIRASLREGLITLMLPASGQYTIDAHSTVGDVICDFAGQPHNHSWRFSHSFMSSAAAPHKLDLRIRFGDIIIRKEP